MNVLYKRLFVLWTFTFYRIICIENGDFIDYHRIFRLFRKTFNTFVQLLSGVIKYTMWAILTKKDFSKCLKITVTVTKSIWDSYPSLCNFQNRVSNLKKKNICRVKLYRPICFIFKMYMEKSARNPLPQSKSVYLWSFLLDR